MTVTRLNAHEATKVPLEIPRQPTLSDLAATANAEYVQIVRAVRATRTHAIRIGEALLQAREQVPKGEWKHWLADNWNASYVLAEQFIRIATLKEHIPEGIESWPDALYALRGLPPINGSVRQYTEAMRAKAKQLRQEGASQCEVAELLGVAQATINNWENPHIQQQRRLRRVREKRARKALAREEQARAVRAAGGPLADAYSLVIRAAQQAGRAYEQAEGSDVKKAINTALNRLYDAEDEMGRAVRLS